MFGNLVNHVFKYMKRGCFIVGRISFFFVNGFYIYIYMYNIIYTHSYYVFGYKCSVFSKYVLYKWNFVHEKCEVMEGIMCSGCFSIYIPKPASQ